MQEEKTFKKNNIMNKITILYFYAEWDGRYKERFHMARICHNNGIKLNFIDCETQYGINMSIRYGVRLCPTVLVFENDIETMRLNGAVANDIIREKYIKK